MSERKPTPEQEKIINAHEGNVIVSACPGSGKTTTLALRAASLPAHETKLVLAFNKKAEEEFKLKMGNVPAVKACTFHSFCMQNVYRRFRALGYKQKPVLLMDMPLAKQYRKALDLPDSLYSFEDMNLDETVIKEADHSLYCDDIRKILKSPSPDHTPRDLETYKAILVYREWLLNNGHMTFDSMTRITAQYSAGMNHPADHIMVDEYQDVDRFQYDIVMTAAALPGVRSCVVVGDPNQRIYEWRGALTDAFTDADDGLTSPRTLRLTINFRSYAEIVAKGETICKVGINAARGVSPDGNAVEWVRPTLNHLDIPKHFGENLHKSAILCRYNRDVLRWQMELVKQNYPVYVMGGKDFWAVKHVRICMEAKKKKFSPEDLFASAPWLDAMKAKAYRDDAKKVEAEMDVRWLMELSDKEIESLKFCFQNEKAGIRISTIHKTKGMEFDTVLLSGIDEKLMKETFVYYVAVTRAKNKLWLF